MVDGLSFKQQLPASVRMFKNPLKTGEIHFGLPNAEHLYLFAAKEGR